jgi:hypothetical protein
MGWNDAEWTLPADGVVVLCRWTGGEERLQRWGGFWCTADRRFIVKAIVLSWRHL